MLLADARAAARRRRNRRQQERRTDTPTIVVDELAVFWTSPSLLPSASSPTSSGFRLRPAS